MKRWDFIVVGGGAAGLAAGAELGEAGARVLILEARARAGGRIWTRRARGWPVPVELGAEFVHGRRPELFELAREAGLAVVRLPNLHREARGGGRFVDMGEVWRRFESLTKRMRSQGRDRSIAQFLASHPKLAASDRRLITSMVESYNAAPMDRASEQALSTAGEGPSTPDDRAQFRVLSGYDGVVRSLEDLAKSAGCRIELSTVVRAVRWRRGEVDVRTGSARIRARGAVITLPAGVLKAPPGSRGSVAFDPEPVSIRRALEGIEMGDVVRLVLRFREAFWRTTLEEADFVHANGPFRTLWTAAPLDLPMLTLWGGGPAARALRSGRRPAVLDAALRQLARIFRVSPARTRRLLVGAHSHDWTGDAFSRGAYSYQVVGGSSAPGRLARPVQRTLFFAGEAASSEASGTVPGAIASGRHAARLALG